MVDGGVAPYPQRRLWEPAAAVGIGVAAAVAVVVGSIAASPLVAATAVIAMSAGAAMVAFAPGLALIAMAFVVPLERLGRFGDDLELSSFSLMRLVGLLALVAVLAHTVTRRQQLALSTPLTLLAILQAQAIASIFYALDPDATKAHALTMLGALLMFFTIAQGVRDWRLADCMILAWLAATLAICIYQVYDWHFGVSASDLNIGTTETRFSATLTALSESGTLGASRRAIGTTSNAAVYGINLLLAAPFLFYRLRLARDPRMRALWLLAIGLLFYNLMLTNTRAVLIYAVLLCAMMVVAGLVRATLSGAILAMLAIFALVPLLPQSVWDRVLNLHAYELGNATNLTWRFELWASALHLGAEHWLTGVGVGNRTEIIAGLDPTRFDGGWIMAHNEFLQVFTELGLPGLAVFVAFLASLIWKAWSLMRLCTNNPALERQYWFAGAALCTLLIAPMFGLQVDVFHFPLKGWWLAAGLVVVADRLTREVLRRGGGRIHVS